MARMRSIKVTLSDDERRLLETQASAAETSLSAVVRGLVRESMEHAAPDIPHVWELAGLLPHSDFSGKDHDGVLYDE